MSGAECDGRGLAVPAHVRIAATGLRRLWLCLRAHARGSARQRLGVEGPAA